MAKKIFLLLWCLFILVSCRIGDSVVAVSTITPIPSLTSTMTSTATFTPAQTGTPTVSPEVMSYQCLHIDDQQRADIPSKGVIVTNDERNEWAFLWNNETMKLEMFPREEADRLFGFEVSQNRKHILYIHYSVRTKEDRLVIATADGKPIWSKKIDDYAWTWFDNERLVHLEVLDDGTHKLSLLNPFNDEMQELPADFPDSALYSGDWYPNWSGLSFYDPTQSRVLYPRKFSLEKQQWPIVLWDAKLEQAITEVMTVNDWGRTPLWTPNGQKVFFAASIDVNSSSDSPKELYAIERDGIVKQLTHFADYFSKVDILDGYSLSPNANMLAFWIVVQPSLYKDPRLAVLNIETGDVTNYCITGDTLENYTFALPEPIWSPDSNQLLVISRNPEDTQERRIVMVDIINKYAAKIEKDMQPVGWMVAP